MLADLRNWLRKVGWTGEPSRRSDGEGGSLESRQGGHAFSRVHLAGDEALLFSFGADIDPAVNARVQAFAAAVRLAGIPGVRGATPGYLSVLVEFDGRQLRPEDLVTSLQSLPVEPAASPAPRTHEIPVCYGGRHGPDLEQVARETGLAPDEVVRLHAGTPYRVYCLGFSPGFPYCAPLPATLRLPRRSEPRTAVPRGSVAIAGHQTGIYPLDTAGGWHLIGRTPLDVFAWDRPQPALVLPGDTVVFRPIDEAAFERLRQEADADHRRDPV